MCVSLSALRASVSSAIAKISVNDGPLQDGRDDLQFAAAAVRAVLQVDFKDSLEQQAARCASIAQSAAYLGVPAAADLLRGPQHGSDWPLRGSEFRAADVGSGSTAGLRQPTPADC